MHADIPYNEIQWNQISKVLYWVLQELSTSLYQGFFIVQDVWLLLLLNCLHYLCHI